jgi:hypothetical protein
VRALESQGRQGICISPQKLVDPRQTRHLSMLDTGANSVPSGRSMCGSDFLRLVSGFKGADLCMLASTMQLSGSRLFARWPRCVGVATGVIVIAALLTSWVVTPSGRPIGSDAVQNLTMAYNFAMHGVLSTDLPEREHEAGLNPTNYREPLPPIVLGIYLKVLEVLRGPISFDSLFQGSGARLAKLSNGIWGILLCLSVFATLKVLTGTNVLAAVGALVVGVNMDVDSLYTESPAEALLALASFLSMMAIKTRQPLYFWLAGLGFGALILTKAAFLYISLALAACLGFWLTYRWRHGGQRTAIGLVLFIFGIIIVVGPWIGRNYYILGIARVSERGGIVLMYRALKDQMSWTEYLGSFYAWAPEGSIRSAIGKTLGFNAADLSKGGRLQRLNRDGFAEDRAAEETGLPEAAISYYRRARAEREKLEQKLSGAAADAELQKRAMELILAHPIKHLLMTVPFLWRGAPFIAPLLAFFAITAIRWRRYDLIAYMLPAIAMVAFFAAATHNIPRYNEPAQPVAAVLVIAMAQAVIIWARQRLSSSLLKNLARAKEW